MPLTKDKFTMYTSIIYNNGKDLSELITASGLSPDTLNRLIKEGFSYGYIDYDGLSFTLTESGLKALEPYKVKRAVIMAAGFGSRLVPITINTPKALIRINGRPMIETMLDAIVAAGIPEIVIVRGYLGEQFDLLLKRYPMIRFVENPDYKEMNNISSAMKVKELFGNAYVLDSDLYLKNPSLIRPYEYSASYVGVMMEKTDDWRLVVNDGKVTGMKLGGENCYHMYDITYWTEEDGKNMERLLPMLFESPEGKKCYWDDVPLTYYNDEFHIEPRPCKEGDIIEIDTLSELMELDPKYRIS